MRLGPRTGIYAEDTGKKKQEKNREMMINFVRNLLLFASPGTRASPFEKCPGG